MTCCICPRSRLGGGGGGVASTNPPRRLTVLLYVGVKVCLYLIHLLSGESTFIPRQSRQQRRGNHQGAMMTIYFPCLFDLFRYILYSSRDVSLGELLVDFSYCAMYKILRDVTHALSLIASPYHHIQYY